MKTSAEMTIKIKSLLSIFDKVGIANKNEVMDAPIKYHPRNLLPEFESIIVFAQANKGDTIKKMGEFDNYLEIVYMQSEVMNYLDSLGYKSVIVDGAKQDISLVRMGVAAGVGELSPVNSLVVKGFGLTTSLGAIITDAKLIPDKMVSGICIHCNKCIRVCPIRDKAYVQGDLSKCGCGACHDICPV